MALTLLLSPLAALPALSLLALLTLLPLLTLFAGLPILLAALLAERIVQQLLLLADDVAELVHHLHHLLALLALPAGHLA